MKAEFIRSAASPAQFIDDERPKLVFSGRSNVGKSSVINRLVGQRNLARVGSAPGKTAHVNYFLIDGRFYFIDLPGYGYAKVSHAEKQRWAELIEAYFAKSERITLGVQIVDARHAPSALDVQMAQYFQQLCLPWTVIANKTDKLKPSQLAPALALIRQTLVLDDDFPLFPFSSEKGTGREAVLAHLLKST